MPELSRVLEHKQNVIDQSPSPLVAFEAEVPRQEVVSQNGEEVCPVTDRAVDAERDVVRMRREHEARWVRDSKAFLTPSMSKRQEVLHQHLEQLLSDHAAEVRRERERERTPIDKQTNGHESEPSHVHNGEEMGVVGSVDAQRHGVSGNPAFRFDPWSANPQVESALPHPTYVNDKGKDEDEFNREDETVGPPLSWRWPTDRQLNRMLRQGGHQPSGF